jgi:uncharacterized membrane protein
LNQADNGSRRTVQGKREVPGSNVQESVVAAARVRQEAVASAALPRSENVNAARRAVRGCRQAANAVTAPARKARRDAVKKKDGLPI